MLYVHSLQIYSVSKFIKVIVGIAGSWPPLGQITMEDHSSFWLLAKNLKKQSAFVNYEAEHRIRRTNRDQKIPELIYGSSSKTSFF